MFKTTVTHPANFIKDISEARFTKLQGFQVSLNNLLFTYRPFAGSIYLDISVVTSKIGPTAFRVNPNFFSRKSL